MFEIGSSLREARERQGLDIAELEVRTKVRSKYLRALEDENFDQLPAHTYIKGFLRTYADALGLDGQLYVDEYNSRFVAGEEDVDLRPRRVPPSRRPRRRREGGVVLVALSAIALLTALVIAAWKFGGPDEPSVQGVPVGHRPAAAKNASKRVAVEVRAVRGPSFMQVRRGSRVGKPMFSGTLELGQRQRFSAARVYLSVASPRNVVVRLNGNRIAVPPGGELLLRRGA
jgi:hypothetical protein